MGLTGQKRGDRLYLDRVGGAGREVDAGQGEADYPSDRNPDEKIGKTVMIKAREFNQFSVPIFGPVICADRP